MGPAVGGPWRGDVEGLQEWRGFLGANSNFSLDCAARFGLVLPSSSEEGGTDGSRLGFAAGFRFGGVEVTAVVAHGTLRAMMRYLPTLQSMCFIWSDIRLQIKVVEVDGVSGRDSGVVALLP